MLFLFLGQVFLETYGWFLLIGGIILFYLYQKYRPSFYSWKRKREEARDAEEYKKGSFLIDNYLHSVNLMKNKKTFFLRIKKQYKLHYLLRPILSIAQVINWKVRLRVRLTGCQEPVY